MFSDSYQKNPVDTTPTAIFRNTLFKNFSRRKLSTKLTKDSLLQRRGHKKIVLFFPSKFLLMWFQSFKKKSSKKTLFTLFFLHFQVGVVALSIVCHIWKIVPDLYEAIIQIMPTSVPETNITDLLNHCSIHPGEIGEVRT